MLAEELSLDEGEPIKSSSDIKIAFLRQEFREELDEERSLKKEMMSTFKEVQSLEKEYAECEAKLASAGDDAEAMQGALDRMAELQAKLDNADAGSVEKKVDRILGSMGFAPGDADLPVSAFSGGWKMRIGLGKVLLQEPQVILLDEPTNHMDLESVEGSSATRSSSAMRTRWRSSPTTASSSTACARRSSRPTRGRRTVQRQLPQLPEAQGRARRTGDEGVQPPAEGDQGLEIEINSLRNDESAAASRRQKERQPEMEPGGAEHVPRPCQQAQVLVPLPAGAALLAGGASSTRRRPPTRTAVAPATTALFTSHHPFRSPPPR